MLYTLRKTKWMDTLKKLMEMNIKHQFLLTEAKKVEKSMENCGLKSEI